MSLIYCLAPILIMWLFSSCYQYSMVKELIFNLNELKEMRKKDISEFKTDFDNHCSALRTKIEELKTNIERMNEINADDNEEEIVKE